MSANKQIAQKWLNAFNQQDLEKLLKLYHEDAAHYSPKLRVHQPASLGLIAGKPALRTWWADAFARLPDLHYQLLQLTTEDDRVFMEYIRQTPGEDDIRVGETLTIQDGIIIASRVFHS